MRYSVYNYARRQYDYYDAPGPSGTHAGSPPAPRGVGDVGAAPERASWKLPAGAKRMGSGEVPQGRIASLAGIDDVLGDPLQLALYAAIGYVAWRFLR
jgi:hypothetical protein